MVRNTCFPVIAGSLLFVACTGSCQRLPRFRDYPAGKVYTGKNAPLVPAWRKAAAKMNVAETARERPNFAGHYIVGIGSCGGECRAIYVIDAKTGHVYPFGHSLVVYQLYGAMENPPPEVEYRRNSRLIILRGNRDEKKQDFGTHYYV